MCLCGIDFESEFIEFSLFIVENESSEKQLSDIHVFLGGQKKGLVLKTDEFWTPILPSKTSTF